MKKWMNAETLLRIAKSNYVEPPTPSMGKNEYFYMRPDKHPYNDSPVRFPLIMVVIEDYHQQNYF